MNNFSNTLLVLVTTIQALEAHPGMIDYTFLLPGKKECWRESVSLLKQRGVQHNGA